MLHRTVQPVEPAELLHWDSGTTKFSGGNGRNGNTTGTDYGGGGGSSAGTASNGVNATNQNGATAPLGGGDGGMEDSVHGNGIDGNAPAAAVAVLSRTKRNRTGGGGGAGQIKVTYTQLTYKSQILSINTGAGPWCPGNQECYRYDKEYRYGYLDRCKPRHQCRC